jgi:hypothetical protein
MMAIICPNRYPPPIVTSSTRSSERKSRLANVTSFCHWDFSPSSGSNNLHGQMRKDSLVIYKLPDPFSSWIMQVLFFDSSDKLDCTAQIPRLSQIELVAKIIKFNQRPVPVKTLCC